MRAGTIVLCVCVWHGGPTSLQGSFSFDVPERRHGVFAPQGPAHQLHSMKSSRFFPACFSFPVWHIPMHRTNLRPVNLHTHTHASALTCTQTFTSTIHTTHQVKDEHIVMGTIEFDTGFANVNVVYNAICFRPFVNEVLDAAVSHVTELGFFAEVGPLEVFVSRLVRFQRRIAVVPKRNYGAPAS